MPPFVALVLSIGLVIWLFVQDANERPVWPRYLWIPTIFILILSTRPIAYWIGSAEDLVSANFEDIESGPGSSPVDLAVLLTLMMASIRLLAKRAIDWKVCLSQNFAIISLYAFFLCSVLWAEYPFSVVKRVIKDFSIPLVALVLVTEPNFSNAIRRVFLRCSYIVFTFSVLTIKYYPDIGTNQTRSGENMFTGLTTQKNTLGEVCFLYCLVLLWEIKHLRVQEHVGWTDGRMVRRGFMLLMGVWLLDQCNSQTSLICLLIGIGLMWWTGRLLKAAQPKKKLITLLFLGILAYTADAIFKIKDAIVVAMGRDLTFTGRTEIWELVMSQSVNPLIGTGYLMFWDGQHGQNALAELGARITTAHNGYLETYLDGGIVGVVLLLIMLLGRGNAIINRMISGDDWGRMAFIFWFLAMLHNLSESSFFRFGILWFFLVLSMISPPAVRTDAMTALPPSSDNLPRPGEQLISAS